ncbi:hypothetical protein V3W47_14145 [Deinococcus sp. YIM 134068]|uniref:hypothetical protein n=1 Tax=Deinococcus lichenicola TaxID=3118910 RepID=UPI002F92CCFD
MPDLDNVGFKVQGRWKTALVVARREPAALAQQIAANLSRCVTVAAGVRSLPDLAAQLADIAARPFHEREACRVQLPREHLQDGILAWRAAQQVLTDLRDPMLTCEPGDVTRALARRFLEEVADANFFGHLSPKTLVMVFGSEEGGRQAVLNCRRELQDYLDGLSGEFAQGFWEARLTRVPEPEVERRDTGILLQEDAPLNLDALGDFEDEP